MVVVPATRDNILCQVAGAVITIKHDLTPVVCVWDINVHGIEGHNLVQVLTNNNPSRQQPVVYMHRDKLMSVQYVSSYFVSGDA